MIAQRASAVALLGALSLFHFNCSPTKPNPLDQLGTVDLTIEGNDFSLWIADSAEEQARGLMFVAKEQMSALPDGRQRGMIFLFESERERSFWMKNTIIPLDIAYIDARGTVVSIYTMIALDDRHAQYPSNGAAKYVIEVNAGVYAEIGLEKGGQVDLEPLNSINPD